MNIIQKIWCFLRGHDMVDEARYDTGHSWIGSKKCLRCGMEHRWQWDHTY